MDRLLILMLSIFLFVLTSVYGQLHGLDGKTFGRLNYRNINEFLLKNANSPYVSEKVKKAVDYLDEHEDEMTDADFAAWELCAALYSLGEHNQCNAETHEIIEKNVIASELNTEERKSKDSPKIRLKYIVYSYAKEYAKTCAKVYSDIFRNITQEMDPNDLATVNDLAFFFKSALKAPNEILQIFWPGYKPSEMFFEAVRNINLSQAVVAADKTISANTKPDMIHMLIGEYDPETDRLVFDRSNTKILVRDLCDKCERYIELVGDLYRMATYDAETNNYPIYGSAELIRGYVNLNVCKSFLKRDRDALALALADYIEMLSDNGHKHN